MITCEHCWYCEHNKGKCPFYKSGLEGASINELQKSARKDDSAAVYLAACLLYGHRTDKNQHKAKSILKDFDKKSYAPAKYLLSQLYFSNPLKPIVKPDVALKSCESAAYMGCNLAAIQLYHCYLNGHSVEQDFQEAGKWCEFAATHGSTDMYKTYAEMCSSNEWGVYNLKNACKYFGLSSNGDDQIKKIAFEYAEECFAQKDYKNARTYYEKALKCGNSAAYDKLVELHTDHLKECYGDYASVTGEYDYIARGDYYLNNGYKPNVRAALSEYNKAVESLTELTNEQNTCDSIIIPTPLKYKQSTALKGIKITLKEAREKIKKCYSVLLTATDNAELRTLYEKATEGDAKSQYELAVLFADKNFEFYNLHESTDWLRLVAEQGDSSAQNMLGNCYFNGEGTDVDYNKAVKWYRLSAEKGNALAQSNLGICYSLGSGVDKDSAEAVKWFGLSARQGNTIAQYNLGYCFFNGEGVKKDYATAAKWYILAAQQGHAIAQSQLGYLYHKGMGVEKDSKNAAKWFKLSAGQGRPYAQNCLGKFYCNGDGVEKDYAEAVKWFRLSAEQGYADAQYNLGCCYYNGAGTEKDYAEAMKWFNLAAQQQHSDAKDVIIKCQKAVGGGNAAIESAFFNDSFCNNAETFTYDQVADHKNFLEKQFSGTLTAEERDKYDRFYG